MRQEKGTCKELEMVPLKKKACTSKPFKELDSLINAWKCNDAECLMLIFESYNVSKSLGFEASHHGHFS